MRLVQNLFADRFEQDDFMKLTAMAQLDFQLEAFFNRLVPLIFTEAFEADQPACATIILN
jgi:hypothetical protein